MKNLKRKKIAVYCLMILGMFLFTGISVLYSGDSGLKLLEKFKPYEPDTPLIPKDVKINPDFVAGKGEKIGYIQKVVGKAYVIHLGEKTAYQLKKNNPLFLSDTLVTSSNSRLNAVMKDKSILALAPMAKLTIAKSEYSRTLFRSKRSTIMNLVWGSARFIVKKISGKSDFMVKTKTAVCGVRATDFAVSVAPVDEAKKLSALNRFLAFLSPVQKAHALAPGQTITTVVTGQGSTVGLTGDIGGTTVVGSASVASAIGGSAASGASAVGASAAEGILGDVAPGLGSASTGASTSTSSAEGGLGGDGEGGGGGGGGGGGSH
ncbi:MAG: FecR domain-containing protein [Desulfobacula sp.]|jgi:hypothetical protein|nr:FecR domain-containing protein [Desulfobacula sp.]MBT7261502.1 FecR domain-containing protein [Desulfobacula sp.]